MSTNKKQLFILVIILLINSSCIDEYIPQFGSNQPNKISVFGQITDTEGYQFVTITTSTTLENPRERPVTGCNVTFLDDNENSFDLEEYENGHYRVWIAKEFLKPGTSYRLKIVTDSGEEIVSDFDKMPECPKIDSIYYIKKEIPTTNPDKPLQGLQFYIDLDASAVNSQYFKWEIEETWEHHATYPKEYYWDGRHLVHIPPDYSKMICWSTKELSDFYTFTTENLQENKIKKQPLHFVDNLTQRLTYCYSIKVNHFTLSSSAYKFWNQLRVNNELGGLYGRLPINAKGNLKNVTSPKVEVLGIFQASSTTSKRIFISNVPDLEPFYNDCSIGPTVLKFPPYLIYLTENNESIESRCINCDANGGVTTKPDFWPN